MRINAKTIVLSLAALVLLLVIVGISAIGWQVILGPDARPVTSERFEATEARLARGQYLAEGPAHCFFCHSEPDFTGTGYAIKAGMKGAGWAMPIPELNNIASRNITPDAETGVGTWSDDEIARAIREGVRKDGTALFPLMPYLEYSRLDDEDVKSIVVYLRTIPAVRNVVPTRQLPGPLEYIVKTMPKPLTTPQPSHPASTAVERGAYLANLAGCVGCHTPADAQGGLLPGLEFSGGGTFKDPGQGMKQLVSTNITPDASGIAHYDEPMFVQMIRTGQIGGRVLNPLMPTVYFRNMTDADLSDIFAFIRSQKPVRHRVSNTDPPAPCEICGQSHGLGELNKK